jgi:Ni,Fe-hydrogenase III large subunit
VTPRDQQPEIVDIPTDRWHDRIADLIGGGMRFLALWSDSAGRIACACTDGQGTTVLRSPPAPGGLRSIVDVAGAAAWDEREIHDRTGVRFDGHTPLRPLVAHPRTTADWSTPVSGDDVHQVAVGPVHAGVIESGHFRFHVVGERILHLDLRLFYKHRGLEAAAVGGTPELAVRLAQRACAACAVTNAVAVAQAYETAHGGVPDPGLRRARTLLLELERLYNHLNDIGAVCSGIGLAAGAMAFAELKERAQRVNAELTGHRFLFDSVAIGASDLDIDAPAAARVRTRVTEIGAEAALLWADVRANRSVRARVRGAGILVRGEAMRLGACGPAGRASGLDDDVRAASGLLWYPGFVGARLDNPTGDVAARIEIRAREIAVCCAIIDDLLSDPIRPGRVTCTGPATGPGVAVVESPRGRTVAIVDSVGAAIAGLHLRTGSYANWPALAAACTGAILPDFPLINKSFELCYACVDR